MLFCPLPVPVAGVRNEKGLNAERNSLVMKGLRLSASSQEGSCKKLDASFLGLPVFLSLEDACAWASARPSACRPRPPTRTRDE